MNSKNSDRDYILKTTQDGAHTFFLPDLNEHYHSINGAISESLHLFVESGFKHFLKTAYQSHEREEPDKKEIDNKFNSINNIKQITGDKVEVAEKKSEQQREINILEIGFGTGLNAFLTLIEAENISQRLFYQTLELYPLSIDLAKELNYPELYAKINTNKARSNLTDSLIRDIEYDKSEVETAKLREHLYHNIFLQLHSSAWEKVVELTAHFKLLKQKIDFSKPTNFSPDRLFDLIYFDAFAPNKQPEMWEEDIFRHIYNLSEKGAILTTYSAKGSVRRVLQSVGFRVERIPGPPGKREMLRATRED